jgi:hypothetical protein
MLVPATAGPDGWSGDAVDVATRLVEGDQLREAIDGGRTSLALAVSDEGLASAGGNAVAVEGQWLRSIDTIDGRRHGSWLREPGPQVMTGSDSWIAYEVESPIDSDVGSWGDNAYIDPPPGPDFPTDR